MLDACSGDAALKLLAGREHGTPIHAVISDMVMPGMDGMTLVRTIRAQYPLLPAILASGYVEEAIHGDLAAEGISFVPKPYRLKALGSALEQVACR